MTDPNKAAVTESNTQFLARMKATPSDKWSQRDTERILNWAEERVMIEEHRLSIHAPYSETTQGWLVVSTKMDKLEVEHPSFSTALRSVAAKIGEGNG